MTSKIEDDDLTLYAAIGRVASQSANLDDTLRNLLHDLVGISDEVWVLFEGQSTDWLVNSCRAVFKVTGPSYHWSADLRDRVAQLLARIDSLRRQRNIVIHGVWSRQCFYRHDEEKHCISRPNDLKDDSETYYFMRSNQRKIFEEAHLSVADIESLAQDILQANLGIWELRKQANRQRHYDETVD